MSEHIASPRITAPNLDAFVNKHVSIVGKVTQLRGDQATIDADGTVTILLNRVPSLLSQHSLFPCNGNAALFIGKVNPDLSIKALSSRDVGANVDMGLCSQVAEVTQRYKALFGGADN